MNIFYCDVNIMIKQVNDTTKTVKGQIYIHSYIYIHICEYIYA